MLISSEGWTYGAEHEFGDWDRRRGIPTGFKLDERDITMVNSNGIAVDPKGKVYPFGGEFNTPPTDSPLGQVTMLVRILTLHPDVAVNYRSNLHVHVRVPGLGADLDALKRLALFNLQWLERVLPLVEPIPEPLRSDYPGAEEYEGARVRYRRRRRSHQTMLTRERVMLQATARTVQEFHDLGVPKTQGGKPLPYCQPRCAVNLRQLLETDTIEFRHFPGTKDAVELVTAIDWCRDYLRCAFMNGDPVQMFHRDFAQRTWPKFQPYEYWMEQRYQRTNHGLQREVVIDNIRQILEEDARVGRFSSLSR